MKRQVLVCFTLLNLLLIAAGGMGSPASAAPGGNSANAKACQKDGWGMLARSGDSGTPFVNQGECVSYGAHGGTLAPYDTRTVSVVMAYAISQGEAFCVPQITATGFAPSTTYSSDHYYDNALAQQYPITTDANGGFSGPSISLSANQPVNFQVSIDGVFSPVVQYFCQP